jgi:hypothetical protein
MGVNKAIGGYQRHRVAVVVCPAMTLSAVFLSAFTLGRAACIAEFA